MNLPAPVELATTPAEGPGLKRATGFLFTIVASLLLSDYLTNGVKVLNTGPSAVHIILLVGAGVNLFRIVVDNFIYYEGREHAVSSWPIFQWRIVLTMLEMGVLLLAYDLVYQFDYDTIEKNGGVMPLAATRRVALDFGLIEGLWFIWDWANQKYRTQLRRSGASPPPEPDAMTLDRWFLMNALWAIGFLVISALCDTGIPRQKTGLSAAVLVGAASLTCAASYIVGTRPFYSQNPALPRP